MTDPYASCLLCPRRCAVDRSRGETGFCAQGVIPKLAWVGLHFGEEPPVSARGGSGTVFFSGCTLGCSFCQNKQISHDDLGSTVLVDRLADMIVALQENGAENINLVTGTQFAPGIVAAITAARANGLTLPVLWNSSGYETLETLDLLMDTVDVYLPDCKTLDPGLSRKLFGTESYPDFARQAVLHMADQKSLNMAPTSTEKADLSTIERGVIVRHLVLPGYLESTRQVLSWFSESLKERALLSLMFQYTPIGETAATEIPARQINRVEYEQVMEWLDTFEIEEGFVQEMSADTEWLPDFTRVDPFVPGQTVWSASLGSDNRS